ncbi:hypothetical protein UCDDA912_g05218 [Diaporthe ampelina]|uniref:Uncharacterized protein n=1 Tax=Diaporthe ampelina TaxID=1214573 RepID=A0A0G2HIE2_9PEZI|nr:hypothetical protein UCDDA912_g05218 [Diaporthe ampelina]
MDRNGNFDYRNFFYPGPAPLPVQIYPVSGDPRFPFHFPPGTPNINMARGESASPLAREDVTADDAALNQPADVSPPSGTMIAKRDAAAAQSSTTATTTPVKLDHVVQGLSHLLEEAIAFCEDCLKTHKEVVAAASFAAHATRNSLWRELLESRLEGSGVHKDLLHTLVPRVRRYTQQAQQAVRDGPCGRSGEGDDGDSHYRLALMADKLSAHCKWVGQLDRKALGSSAACENMVENMKEMLELCGKIGPRGEAAAPQDGQDGGQY